ncbi:MAG: LptA/OstA family protein [bacterium]
MEDHDQISWKIVYLATTFSLLVLGIAYYFMSPQDATFFSDEKTEKIAEFKSTRVSGRKQGKKIWEFSAIEGWTITDRSATFLKDVTDGDLYINEKLAVTKLVAPLAKVYQGSEVVEAFGYPTGEKKGGSKLSALLNLGRMSDPEDKKATEWTKLVADSLKYDPNKKVSEIRGDIKLAKKDSTIYSQYMMVYHEAKTATIHGDLRLERQDGVLRSDKLFYYSQDEKLEAKDSVNITIRDKGLTTKIKTNQAIFYNDITEPMTFYGSIEVSQPKKLAIAKQGFYSQKENKLVLSQDVKAIFEKASAIIGEDSAKKLKGEKEQGVLKEKTLLNSDKLVFSTRSGDATAQGSVHVTQKGKEAKSDQAIFNDESDILTLTGNVYIKQEDGWVSARQVIVSVTDETLEATGSVEAKFKL